MSGSRFLLAAVVLALFIAPYAGDHEWRSIDAEVRSHASGRFVELSDGYVHYDLLGRDDAETVVMVHGFSSPYYIWGELPRRLLAAGYRVLRYDLYGRGFSDRPYVDYGLDLYDRQLTELLAALSIDRPFHLLGLSMGGALVTDFSDRHPQLVSTLTLIDPAGFPARRPLAARLLEVPLLGRYLMNTFGDRFLVARNETAVFDKDLVPELKAKFSRQLRYKGFKRAILSTARHVPLESMRPVFERVGKTGLPVLLLWGLEDEIIDVSTSARVKAAMPNSRFRVIESAGHLPHYERPEVVTPIILDFLADHPAAGGG